jgi:hypothetical protein
MSNLRACHVCFTKEVVDRCKRPMQHCRDGWFPLAYRQLSHHTVYKHKGGLKQDDLRRRREEQQVETRRQKRERNFVPNNAPGSDEEESGMDPPVRRPLLISQLSPSPSPSPECHFFVVGRRDNGR